MIKDNDIILLQNKEELIKDLSKLVKRSFSETISEIENYLFRLEIENQRINLKSGIIMQNLSLFLYKELDKYIRGLTRSTNNQILQLVEGMKNA
jgi:hypothetical protein